MKGAKRKIQSAMGAYNRGRFILHWEKWRNNTAKCMAITRDVRTFVMGLEAGMVTNRTRQDIPGRKNSTCKDFKI